MINLLWFGWTIIPCMIVNYAKFQLQILDAKQDLTEWLVQVVGILVFEEPRVCFCFFPCVRGWMYFIGHVWEWSVDCVLYTSPTPPHPIHYFPTGSYWKCWLKVGTVCNMRQDGEIKHVNNLWRLGFCTTWWRCLISATSRPSSWDIEPTPAC